MNGVMGKLYGFHRKLWGTYEVDDPRPIKERSPYTFYLPSRDKLESIEIGDSIQIIIKSIPAGAKYNGERMWVTVTSILGDDFVGVLDNIPLDMPQLRLGDSIKCKRWHVIDCQWQRPNKENEFTNEESVQKWERCLVDSCVTDNDVSVSFIYREEPDLTQDEDKYPDSGWRIRGDTEQMTCDEYENVGAKYIALGAVLNHDDSWVHLIDEPVGSRFFKNKRTGEFERD